MNRRNNFRRSIAVGLLITLAVVVVAALVADLAVQFGRWAVSP